MLLLCFCTPAAGWYLPTVPQLQHHYCACDARGRLFFPSWPRSRTTRNNGRPCLCLYSISKTTSSSKEEEKEVDDDHPLDGTLFDIRAKWNPKEFWKTVLSSSSRHDVANITYEGSGVVVSKALDFISGDDNDRNNDDDNDKGDQATHHNTTQQQSSDSKKGLISSTLELMKKDESKFDNVTGGNDKNDTASSTKKPVHRTSVERRSSSEKKEKEGFMSGVLEYIEDAEPPFASGLDGLAKNFEKLVGSSSNNDYAAGDDSNSALNRIVESVRDGTEQGDVKDTTTMFEIFQMINSYKDDVAEILDKFLGDIYLSKLTPTALLYYVERQDEVKNPSYKRRVHRFCSGIDMSEMDRLYDSLNLANLAYADTVKEIREGLENHTKPYELVYANVVSEIGRPAFFLAVECDHQTKLSSVFETSALRAILVVRGTKTVADAVTDIMCDSEDYLGGKAHSFILESGKYIAEQQRDLLLELCETSGRQKVDLTVIGHSLGAGAASIAGMELNAMDDSRISAKVVCFGCPAMVSEDLAKQSDFITTVVNDDDVVPRLSGATLANAMLDVLEFDWTPYVKNDVRFAIDEARSRQPKLFNEKFTGKIWGKLEPMLESAVNGTILPASSKRLSVEFFPPGKCIHIYRDGVGFSGCYVPNTFFSEINLSRRMVNDHLFQPGYQKTLLEIERQRKGDNHYSFDETNPVNE